GCEHEVVVSEGSVEETHRGGEGIVPHASRELADLESEFRRVGFGEFEQRSFTHVVEAKVLDRRQPCDYSDRGDPVGVACRGGEGMGTAGGPADDRGTVDPEFVEQCDCVCGEVDNSAVKMLRRCAVTWSVKRDDPDAG